MELVSVSIQYVDETKSTRHKLDGDNIRQYTLDGAKRTRHKLDGANIRRYIFHGAYRMWQNLDGKISSGIYYLQLIESGTG